VTSGHSTEPSPDPSEDWPDPLGAEYELRLTKRALEDLGADGCAAGDLNQIVRATTYPDIVEKFRKQRTEDPGGTESSLSKVHRNDIFKLDGRDGQRAVTWHDTAHGVVWMLGFTPKHDYKLFEQRAACAETRGLGGTTQLMPSVEDYEGLIEERADREADRVLDALAALVRRAVDAPGATVRGELAGIVRAEAHVVVADASTRLHLRFRTPPIRRGVLDGGFEWWLPAMVHGVVAETIRREDFPGAAVRGALIVAADLDP
jgi:hypothetical protein